MRTLMLAAAFLVGSVLPGFAAGYDDLNQGISAYNHKDWDGAIALFDKALADGDLTADQQLLAHLDRALSLESKGDIAGAITELDVCVAVRPRDKILFTTRLILELKAVRLDTALEHINAYIAANPDDDAGYVWRSGVYEQRGDLEKALENQQLVQTKIPDDKSTMLRIGITYFLMGKYDDALAAFDKFQGSSNYDVAWLWKSLLALKQNKTSTDFAPITFMVGGVWPIPIVKFFKGDLSESEMFAAVPKSTKGTESERLCQAHFFAAEWRALHGDMAGAKPLFEDVAKSCSRGLPEWYAATVELMHVS